MNKSFKLSVACVLLCGCIGGNFGGCSSSTVYNGHEYTLNAGQSDRQRVIQVVREVLSDYRFVIDRVDGRRGVVTTEFKSTQGIASPWDTEQGSFKEEAADLINQHERSVRVSIGDDGSVVVSVLVQRIHRPSWRIETESISRSTHAMVIGTDGRREASQVVTPIGIDGQLARRLGEEISKRLSTGSSSG